MVLEQGREYATAAQHDVDYSLCADVSCKNDIIY